MFLVPYIFSSLLAIWDISPKHTYPHIKLIFMLIYVPIRAISFHPIDIFETKNMYQERYLLIIPDRKKLFSKDPNLSVGAPRDPQLSDPV